MVLLNDADSLLLFFLGVLQCWFALWSTGELFAIIAILLLVTILEIICLFEIVGHRKQF